jgi:uncharacterized RDD family membrane protein YckC
MECPFCQSQIGSDSKQCKTCGKLIPPGQYLLEESGITETSSPLTFVADTVARTQDQYRFARLGDRFIAFLLDSTFLFGLFAVVDAWAFMRWGSVDGSELQLTTASLLIAITLNAGLLFLYGSLLEAAWGATLGKAIVGIRVVGTSRRRFFSACAIRNVLRIVDGMGFYLVGTFVAGCSSVRQRLGDIYARTVVIEESFGSGPRVAAMVLWIASLATATWLLPRICRANHFIRPPFLSQVIIRVGRREDSAYFRLGRLAVNVELESAARAANQ